MTSTTPLLLLLDSVLSQDQGRIRDARTRIRQIVADASDGNPALKAAALAPIDNRAVSFDYLLQDVDMMLTAFPNLSAVRSDHDGSLPLHFAASIGNVQVATRILSHYPEAASTPNTKGKIPLHYAAREGRSDMVAYFLYATPHTAKIMSKKKKLALHFAAGDGHTDVVQQLLRVYPEGASLQSAKGKVALHFAARWGHMQIASDLLFVYPECARCVDWDGSLPLHDAAREGQVVMSKFLIERYPTALSIANIRGEIPLFPAVRSGNVNLVILYLQGWALGGREILKAVSADDNIHDWDWNITELLLRGAVENFSDCPLMKGKEPPAVCCTVERGVNRVTSLDVEASALSAPRETETSLFERQMSTTLAANIYSKPPGATSRPPMTECTTGTADPNPRSKSPILEEIGAGRSKKRLSSGCGNERKRLRSRHWHEDESLGSSASQQRKFIALHAAFSCGASSHVIRCVLNMHAGQVSECNERGQFPLHIAVRHPACSNDTPSTREDRKGAEADDDKKLTVEIVLKDILKSFPEAAMAFDSHERLPLHLAIASRADSSIVQNLLQINPSSGVDPVDTDDVRFKNKPPLYMATEFDCDLTTTYLLLRGDPGAIFLSGSDGNVGGK